jgi:serine/threonine protein kinase
MDYSDEVTWPTSLDDITPPAAPHRVAADVDSPLGEFPYYRLGREIGRGGMSVVYVAVDQRTNEEVAIKILYPYFATNRDLVNRLRREIEVLQRIRHPNIIRYLDSGERQGCYFYAMEFLRGETLEQRLDREGPISEDEACRIILNIAYGLAEAHSLQIVHRDVKPGNIFLTDDGKVKLVDFGLAKDETDRYQTQLGLVVGTPLYLAPEQARGEAGIDGRCDIYSLGISLFHSLTGRVPYQELSMPLILTKKTVEAIPSPREYSPDLSENLANIVGAMCERNIHLRYPVIRNLIVDLERHLARQPSVWVEESYKNLTMIAEQPLPLDRNVLSDPLLKSLMLESNELTEKLSFPADHVIFYEGEESKDVYLLISGEVEVLKAGIRITILNTPGAFFGEMSGLLGIGRSTTIRTSHPTCVVRIDHETFENFLKGFPPLNYRLAMMLAERLQRTTADYYNLRNRFHQLVRHVNVLNGLVEETEKAGP